MDYVGGTCPETTTTTTPPPTIPPAGTTGYELERLQGRIQPSKGKRKS